MPSSDELSIIEGLRSGGTERLRNETLLWKKFYGFIHSSYLAKDDARIIYDDTILEVISNIMSGKYEERKEPLVAYAHKIFYYKSVDLIRKRTINNKRGNIEKKYLRDPVSIHGELSEKLPANVKNVIEEIIAKEDKARMHECLDKLGDKCKEILLLYGNNKKDKIIFEMMDYASVAVIKSTRHRCLAKLTEYFFKFYIK